MELESIVDGEEHWFCRPRRSNGLYHYALRKPDGSWVSSVYSNELTCTWMGKCVSAAEMHRLETINAVVANHWYPSMKGVCAWLVAIKMLAVGLSDCIPSEIWYHIAYVYGQYVEWKIKCRDNTYGGTVHNIYAVREAKYLQLLVYKTFADMNRRLNHNIPSINWEATKGCAICGRRRNHSRGGKCKRCRKNFQGR